MADGKKSYAEAMRAVPATHINAIMRTEIIRRQVVMRRDPVAGLDCIQGLTEKEILPKAT